MSVNRAAIMKGLIGVIPDIDVTTPQFKSNVRRWRAQPPTVTYDAHGVPICNNATDDGSGAFLYKGQADGRSTSPYTCTGLVFSSFPADGSTLTNNSLFQYDAVYAAAYALHTYLYEMGANYSTLRSSRFRDNVFSNVSFTGVTGTISISDGLGGPRTHGAGDRRVGAYYRIINYQVCTANGAQYPCAVIIGSYHSENGYRDCVSSGYKACGSVVFNTADNSQPLDWPNPVRIYMNISYQIILWLAASMCALLIIGFTAMVSAFRKTPIIRASQPSMLYFVLLGCSLGVARIIVFIYPLTSRNCITVLWLGHLGYGIVFGTLLLKTWRIHRLVNSGLKRIRITSFDINISVLGSILGLCVYLLAITIISMPQVGYYKTVQQNQIYISAQCSYTNTTMPSVLLVIEAFVLIVGVRLCWLTKGAPDEVNEAAYIAIGTACCSTPRIFYDSVLLFLRSLLTYLILFHSNLCHYYALHHHLPCYYVDGPRPHICADSKLSWLLCCNM